MIRVRFPKHTDIFLFYATATPPTQLPIQWTPGRERPGHEANSSSMYDNGT
jgi:hypothetical protein